MQFHNLKSYFDRDTPGPLVTKSLLSRRDNNISSIFANFPVVSLIFPQIFFLIMVFRVGEPSSREGPGYVIVLDTHFVIWLHVNYFSFL